MRVTLPDEDLLELERFTEDDERLLEFDRFTEDALLRVLPELLVIDLAVSVATLLTTLEKVPLRDERTFGVLFSVDTERV